MTQIVYSEHSIAHAHLPAFVFLQNTEHRAIHLDLAQVGSLRDIFYFLLHLLCKGMILMFGQNNSISIEDLDVDKLYELNSKLRCIGIKLHVTTIDLDEPRLGVFYDTPEHGQRLEDFKLIMYSRTQHHTLWFEPIHYVPDNGQLCHTNKPI